jgi:hypothetical protein
MVEEGLSSEAATRRGVAQRPGVADGHVRRFLEKVERFSVGGVSGSFGRRGAVHGVLLSRNRLSKSGRAWKASP